MLRIDANSSPYQVVDSMDSDLDRSDRSPSKFRLPFSFGSALKYNTEKYKINVHTPIKEESKQANSNTSDPASYDIFSGFRHWWQDNITNNQRLMGGLGSSQMDGNASSS